MEEIHKKLRRRSLSLIAGTIALLGWALWPGHGQATRVGLPAPEITNDTWVNSEPKRLSELRGKVVLVEFWTFGCYNCRNVEPYIKTWHDKYGALGLVIIGVHSPEFGYERVIKNVRNYVREHDIRYAIAIDNEFAIWNRYKNRYWPAMYLIDKQGIIRYTRVGEGGYEQTESKIRELLEEPSRR